MGTTRKIKYFQINESTFFSAVVTLTIHPLGVDTNLEAVTIVTDTVENLYQHRHLLPKTVVLTTDQLKIFCDAQANGREGTDIRDTIAVKNKKRKEKPNSAKRKTIF
jgi:hypothetical protein